MMPRWFMNLSVKPEEWDLVSVICGFIGFLQRVGIGGWVQYFAVRFYIISCPSRAAHGKGVEDEEQTYAHLNFL